MATEVINQSEYRLSSMSKELEESKKEFKPSLGTEVSREIEKVEKHGTSN